MSGGGGSSTTSYTYTVSMALALCEGPVQGIGDVWVANSSTAVTAASLGFTDFLGALGQGGWSYLVTFATIEEAHAIPATAPYQVTVDYTAAPFTDGGVVSGSGEKFTAVASAPTLGEYVVADGVYTFAAADAGRDITISYSAANQEPPNAALSYSGVAYLAVANYDLGDSAQLPNHNVEVMGFFADSVEGSQDADPSLVVSFILTDAKCGVAPSFPVEWIGDLSSYQAYCVANGLLLSVAFTEATSADQTLSDIATYTNADVAWTGAALTILPRGDQAVSGNGATYTPPVFTFALTDQDFLPQNSATTSSGSSSSDPLILTAKRPEELSNVITLEYLARANGYNPETVTACDLASVQTYGRNASDTKTAHYFAEASAARLSAQLMLQRAQIANTWQGTVGEHCVAIDIGDVGTITNTRHGLRAYPVRVTEITEQSDGSILLAMEDYPTGLGTASAMTAPAGKGGGNDYNADPGDVNVPAIFEPPDALANGLALWIALSGAASVWGGAEVLASTDQGESYASIGFARGPSVQGKLTAALPAVSAAFSGPTIDAANTLAVLVEDGELVGTTQAGALAMTTTLCWIDGEVVAFQNATLTGTKAYALSWLVRGCYDTPITAHAAGAPFALLSGALFKTPILASQIGQTVYFKFASFNIWGGPAQSMENLEPYAHTITGAALTTSLPAVAGFGSAYVAGISQLTWREVDDFRSPIDYEIRMGADPQTAQVLGRTARLQTPTQGDGTYWIAAHYQVPNGPDIYSETWADLEITGSQLTTNVAAGFSEAATGWGGTCTDTMVENGRLALAATGDIRAASDVTAIPDVVFYGGVEGAGTYHIPAGHIVKLARVSTCNVVVKLGAVLAQSDAVTDVRTIPDVTAVANLSGISLGGTASAIVQIRTSQDGVSWGAWQDWIAGAYTGLWFDFQVILSTSDPAVAAVLTDLAVEIDVPAYTQSGTSVAVPAAGLAVTFQQPFNGGPNGSAFPNLQVTIEAMQPGDTAVITAKSLTGFTLQIVNGGAGVARTVDWIAQGY